MIKPTHYLGILILLFLVFTACGSNNEKIPSSVVPKDTMVFVLMDIHIAEAGARTLDGEALNKTVVNYYQFIEDKYHIDEKEFKESMFFYTNHPKLLEEIYARMVEEMSKKELVK